MLRECVAALEVKPDGIYVDCTLGGGGHSEAILSRLTNGILIAIDKDIEAIDFCKQRFSANKNIIYVKSDFKNIAAILEENSIGAADGILADLGVSSRQLDDKDRGFSYIKDSRLDMRMDKSQKLSAWDVVNAYSEQRLFEIIRDYGEDKFAKNIAKNIISARLVKPIDTTKQLAEIADRSIPYALKKTGGHPAKRTFQAIRIEVNGELEGLEKALTNMIGLLKPDGVLTVLTFHSLEDRIVKNLFKEKSTGCVCPKSFPVCVCGHKAEVGRPWTAVPSSEEKDANPRAESARLRAVKKL